MKKRSPPTCVGDLEGRVRNIEDTLSVWLICFMAAALVSSVVLIVLGLAR